MTRRLLLPLCLLGSFVLISSTIDLNNLFNYSNQVVPAYINADNTPVNNTITDEGATLGRVLFYDKMLSANNTVACASCHLQEFAFSDTATVSVGLNGGVTGRHSMRLVNARFSNEVRFFWDERAASLEDQTTMPIQDHVEMGFSGANGDPDFDSLVRKLEDVSYYKELFPLAFGDTVITENRISRALAQFVRSIQSFDSKYDVGRAQVNNNGQPFPNFTPQENMGKQLFTAPPQNGGAGCQGCHGAPEFAINPNINGNNGVISVAGDPNATDLTNRKSPTLRDLVNANGDLNGPMMHDGSFTSLLQVIDHYNLIVHNPAVNPNLAPALGGGPNGQGQNLNLTQGQKNALVAFLETLAGSDVYTNEIWSDPFDANGNLTIESCQAGLTSTSNISFSSVQLNWETFSNANEYEIRGRLVGATNFIVISQPAGTGTLVVNNLPSGTSYEWEYRVVCDSAGLTTSAWSGLETFTTLDCDDVPTPLSTSMLTETSVRLNWTPTANAAGYQIQGRQLGGGLVSLIVVGGTTSFKDIVGLTPGTTYEWFVRSLCNLGEYSSNYSEIDTFATIDLDAGSEVKVGLNSVIELETTAYPNPFRDFVNIRCNCNMEMNVAVYNMAGQKVIDLPTQYISNQTSIPTAQLKSGVYFVNGTDAEGNVRFLHKMVKGE